MAFIRDRETGDIMDPERDAILISKGGGGDSYKFWELIWNGQAIGFMAKDTNTYGGEHRRALLAIHWLIVSMDIPEDLRPRREEIKGLIKESMEATWLYHVPRREVKVTADFDHNFIK